MQAIRAEEWARRKYFFVRQSSCFAERDLTMGAAPSTFGCSTVCCVPPCTPLRRRLGSSGSLQRPSAPRCRCVSFSQLLGGIGSTGSLKELTIQSAKLPAPYFFIGAIREWIVWIVKSLIIIFRFQQKYTFNDPNDPLVHFACEKIGRGQLG